MWPHRLGHTLLWFDALGTPSRMPFAFEREHAGSVLKRPCGCWFVPLAKAPSCCSWDASAQ